MRKRLMAAAAIAPLMIGYQAAYAQSSVTISSDTSTPVATATAVSGGPGDVILASGATFTIKDATPAFTLNSNNSISNTGTITSNNIDNATGVLVQGPFTGSVTNSGAINLSESYSAGDSANSDGIPEAPFAQGSNRIGIRVVGPLTGGVFNTGTISIQGNNSTAISIENTLAGGTPTTTSTTTAPTPSLLNSGTISVVGNNAYGIRTTGEITGDVNVSGGISMKGAGSVAVQTNAPIDGALRVYGTLSTTGYAVTGRQTGQIQTNIQKTPADVQQGGSALQITSNVKGGVFLGAPPPNTAAGSTADADLDGIPDGSEAASSLTTYGSAPTIQIGGPSAISLGNFGTGINAYGLVIEGTVSGQGVMDGVSATAVDVGAGGAGVNLNGGIRTSGNVNATAYQADATAIHLERGVTGTQIYNSGQISANVTSASANTAMAIQIDAGAAITSLNNGGSIVATTTGDSANALVFVDKTGAVNSVTNTGTMIASLNPALPGETITGKGVALDLSANTTGVTLLQQQGSDASVSPAIVGDVLLGSGPNTVNLLAGSITGTLSMGGAPSSLTIDNGAVFTGPLLYSGNQLAINVANGALIDKSATTVGASSLNVGASSTLGVALDPVHNASSLFNVSGAATFASGAKISANLLSTPSLAGQTFTIVKAGSLNVGTIDSSALAGLPYLFTGSLATSAASNTISINVRTKSPAEMAFNKAETAGFNAIYTALPQDAGIQTAIITAPDRNSLISAYDQLLPNSSGDVFNTALGMSKAVSRAAADRFDLSTQRDDEDDEDFVVSGFWASEFYSGLEQNKQDNNAYHSAALGVIGGYDFGGTGVTLSAASSNITRPHQVGDSLNSVSVVEGSVYAEPRFGALSVDARLGVGYLKVSNRRQMVAQVVSGDLSSTSTVTRTADGDWSGYDLTAHLGAGLQLDVSKHLFFEPRVYADVFHMHENAYNERNGGIGYDFNVSARDGTQTNGTASVVTGLRFGNLFVISPQLEIGYDKVITGGPGATTARFAYGGPSFTVPANMIDGAAMGRLTLRGDGNYVHFSLQAGGEYNSNYHSLDAKAVFRLTF